jgi:hypothetical protein
MQPITFIQISCQNNDAYFQAISCPEHAITTSSFLQLVFIEDAAILKSANMFLSLGLWLMFRVPSSGTTIHKYQYQHKNFKFRALASIKSTIIPITSTPDTQLSAPCSIMLSVPSLQTIPTLSQALPAPVSSCVCCTNLKGYVWVPLPDWQCVHKC